MTRTASAWQPDRPDDQVKTRRIASVECTHVDEDWPWEEVTFDSKDGLDSQKVEEGIDRELQDMEVLMSTSRCPGR